VFNFSLFLLWIAFPSARPFCIAAQPAAPSSVAVSESKETWVLEHCGQALRLRRAEGDRAEEAQTLNNIGSVYVVMGAIQNAARSFRQAALLHSVAQAPSVNYDESKAGTFTLPDPLRFNSGKPVKTARDWTKHRRAEIIQLFQTNVYGRSPKPPKRIRFEIFDVELKALGGKAIRKQVTIYFSANKAEAHEDLLIYLPSGGPRPVPVILALNSQGNQSVTSDPGVKAATIWEGKPPARQQAPERSRGSDQSFDVEKILARGYGFATICYQDLEPDFQGGYKQGIRQLFLKPGQSEPAPDDWGAIGAWAYGLSRAMDYLNKDMDVDAKRVAIMGHSRLGKTVLWAGAQDTRFAMVLASCSGSGGAPLWRRDYGATLKNTLAQVFPYWFCANLLTYVDKTDQLPVDSHELIALIAPRPVYITGAEEDQWADPRGMFLAAVAAGPVYKLLKAEGLGTDQMPAINQPIMHTIAFHLRDGKHAVTAFDWDQFLAFADMHLRAH
jgi:hypothetical protein